MCKGYIKLYRKILDNGIFDNAELLKVYVWTLLRANAAPSEVFDRKLKVGQFVTGKLSAAQELRMRPSTVYDRIKKLEKLGFIKLDSNTKNTVVTIKNYNKYQGFDNTQKRDLERVSSLFEFDVMSYNNQYDEDVLKSFILYWTEPNRSNTKLRYELQQTFSIPRRLARWAKNNFDKKEAGNIFDSWKDARNNIQYE